MQVTFIQSLAAAALLVASAAQAQTYLVDTQVPTGTLIGSTSISSTQWIAESFSVSAATTIDGIQAYVLSNDAAGDQGLSFDIALYADNGSNLPAVDFNADSGHGQLFDASATYNGDGWNGLNHLNWAVGPGTYWVAIEQSDAANQAGSLQLPTGALPAAAGVAFYSGGQQYVGDSVSDAFGLQVTAAVPEPSSAALMLTSLAVLGFVARRRQA